MTHRHQQLVELGRQLIAECLQDKADPHMITVRYAALLAALREKWRMESQHGA